jgi:hypothetical protein
MKTKKFILTALMFVSLLILSTGTQAQPARSNLDQVKLMQQTLGTWEAPVGKDTVQVRETQQYGKAFITSISLVVKGTKSPIYISNYCYDIKDSKFKGFTLYANGEYSTWIGLYNAENKFNLDVVQNFKPETVLRKVEIVYESPTKMTYTNFNADGKKTGEFKYTKEN